MLSLTTPRKTRTLPRNKSNFPVWGEGEREAKSDGNDERDGEGADNKERVVVKSEGEG